jgi:hypothetical protein
MRHEWLFDVLADMKVYAERHGLVALSAKVDETIEVAHAEIAAAEADDDAPQKQRGDSPKRRRN